MTTQKTGWTVSLSSIICIVLLLVTSSVALGVLRQQVKTNTQSIAKLELMQIDLVKIRISVGIIEAHLAGESSP